MTTNTIARDAGINLLLLGCSLALLACDAPDLQGRSHVVLADASTQEVDDISIDQEDPSARPQTQEDDEENSNPRATGVDHAEPDVAGLRWSDPKRALLEMPKAAEGDWMLEVRADARRHESRWVQGPYDVEEVAETGLRIDPPREAFAANAPGQAVRIMARLVLIDTDGNRTSPLALPALVMQRQADDSIRYALHATLPVEVERDGDETFASADLPNSL